MNKGDIDRKTGIDCFPSLSRIPPRIFLYFLSISQNLCKVGEYIFNDIAPSLSHSLPIIFFLKDWVNNTQNNTKSVTFVGGFAY